MESIAFEIERYEVLCEGFVSENGKVREKCAKI